MLQQAWYSLGRIAVASYAQMMLRMDIARHTPLPGGPKIIAANHPTTADPVWITRLTSEPMHILITEMCFKVPLVGRSLRMAGHVPVGGSTAQGFFCIQKAREDTSGRSASLNSRFGENSR